MMRVGLSVVVLALLWPMGPVAAESLRDPTKPPAEAGQAAGVVDVNSTPAAAMTIIVRGGRSYLAVGTRLYAQGQQLGQARIERISETEVWLREGGMLRKLPQFSGIQRRTVAPTAAKPSCASGASKKSSPGALCADLQP